MIYITLLLTIGSREDFSTDLGREARGIAAVS